MTNRYWDADFNEIEDPYAGRKVTFSPSDTPILSPMDIGELAAQFMTDAYGQPRVSPQLASGVAVYFGREALFVPGEDADKLLLQVGRRIEELACAYLAYRHAEKKEESHE